MDTKPKPPEGGGRRETNRRNSQKSTGPKTKEGKQASAQNASKHGFFTERALLPGESMEEYCEFGSELLQQLRPRDPMEEHLLAQYIPLLWRLRRLPEFEAFAFNRYGISNQGKQCGPAFAMVASVQDDNILGQLARYEGTLRRSTFKYLEFLRLLRRDGGRPERPRIIEAETLEAKSENSPPASPATAAEVQPEASPPDQLESVPAADRAINPPDAEGNHLSKPAGNGSLETNPGSEVEPKSPEHKHHEQSSESKDAG